MLELGCWRIEMGKVLDRVSNEDLISEDVTDLVAPEIDLNDRAEAFCRAYVTNGFNQRQAAISAGYSEVSAAVSANRLLKKDNVTRRIAMLMAPGLKAQGVTLENMLAQISAVANFDPRKLYDANGERIPVHLLDDETAAAVARVNAGVIGSVHGDVIPYDKMKAVDMAMKHLGAYEKDNLQKQENLQLQIILE